MSEHFNGLTPAEAERLSLLLEECGEVLQIVGKIQRHGYESINPLLEYSLTNRNLLQKEIGHLFHALSRMTEAGDIDANMVAASEGIKSRSIYRWLHHQPEVA
jgi:NTP pyrophosphatase (non-canonical NTP hydrolase)